MADTVLVVHMHGKRIYAGKELKSVSAKEKQSKL